MILKIKYWLLQYKKESIFTAQLIIDIGKKMIYDPSITPKLKLQAMLLLAKVENLFAQPEPVSNQQINVIIGRKQD